MLARWTEMELNSPPATSSEDNDIRRLLGSGDEAEGSFAQPKFFYSFAPVVFDLDDIARFNKAVDAEFTVIRFYDGEGCVVKYPYVTFQQLFIQNSGKTILSFVPKDVKVDKKKKPPSKDDLLDRI